MMNKTQSSFKHAKEAAKKLRPVVDPFADFAELLTRLEAAYNTLGYNYEGELMEINQYHIVDFILDMDTGTLKFNFDGKS